MCEPHSHPAICFWDWRVRAGAGMPVGGSSLSLRMILGTNLMWSSTCTVISSLYSGTPLIFREIPVPISTHSAALSHWTICCRLSLHVRPSAWGGGEEEEEEEEAATMRGCEWSRWTSDEFFESLLQSHHWAGFQPTYISFRSLVNQIWWASRITNNKPNSPSCFFVISRDGFQIASFLIHIMFMGENETSMVNVLFARLKVSLCHGLQHPARQEFNSLKLETSFALISPPVNNEASVQCKTRKSEGFFPSNPHQQH